MFEIQLQKLSTADSNVCVIQLNTKNYLLLKVTYELQLQKLSTADSNVCDTIEKLSAADNTCVLKFAKAIYCCLLIAMRVTTRILDTLILQDKTLFCAFEAGLLIGQSTVCKVGLVQVCRLSLNLQNLRRVLYRNSATSPQTCTKSNFAIDNFLWVPQRFTW